MIISPKHRFVFVHIPKCAGTSVRTQLVKCDPNHIALGDTGDHPVLGRIDYGHIPLHQLSAHFVEYRDYIREFDTFAVVRDPLARFGSALRQMLWQYHQQPMTLIPADELRATALRMLDEIEGQIAAPERQYIFFARQSDFIFENGVQCVDHLIPLDLVADFIGHMSRRTGTSMETGTRSNQNVELRYKGLGGLAYRVNGALRRVLPLDLHARIKDTALRVLSAKTSAAEASGVLDLPEVQAFVARHYAADQAIYDQVLQQVDTLQQGLRQDSLPDMRILLEKGLL